MAIAVLDDVMLREPRLLTPGLIPLGPVKIDAAYGNKLGALFLPKGCQFYDLNSRVVLTYVGTTAGVSQCGPGVAFNGEAEITTNYARCTSPSVFGTSGPYTLLVVATWTGSNTADEKGILAVGASTGTYGIYTYKAAGGANLKVSSPSWDGQIIDGGPIILNKPFAYVYRCCGSLPGYLWRDGEYKGLHAAASTFAFESSYFEIGRIFEGVYGDSWPGIIHMVAAWNRALSDTDCQYLSGNPFAVLTPA